MSTPDAAPQQLKSAYTGHDKVTIENNFKFVSIRAGPNTIFLSFEASVVINTEYSKLRREGLNIFFSLIKAGVVCVSV